MEVVHQAFQSIVTVTPAMRRIIAHLCQVASSDASVMILGETGTGKELAARALHQTSPRSEKPFVVVNCAAIPEHLVESELFGYRKGAFTDAKEDKAGKFEAANKGTIFLDEVAELSLAAQAKILRVIETGQVERLGETRPRLLDVRVVSATNADLEKLIEQGRFRKDLYYRLNEVKIVMPPLREKMEDLPVLIDAFIKEFNESMGKKVRGISATALAVLERYHFPGNIRELKSIIKRAMILVEPPKDTIWLEHLPLDIRIRPEEPGERGGEGMTLREWLETLPIGIPLNTNMKGKVESQNLEPTLEEMEKGYIEELLRRYAGNKSRVAKILGIDRTTLYNKIKKYGVR